MKTLQLIKSIALTLLMIIVFGCEKEIAPNTISQQEDVSADHTVNRLSLSDFMNTNTFKSVEKAIIKPKGDQLSYQKGGSGATENQFEFTSNEVLSSHLDGETSYTTPVKKTNEEDSDYNYNLLMKESTEGVTNFLIKYSKTNDQIIIQPIINSDADTNIPTINSEIDCTTWNWSITIPCSCAGHTYDCLCGTAQFPGTASYSNSGNVTVCYETPAIVSFDPSGSGGTGGYDSGQNNGYSNGGSNSDGLPIPIFVYEGDSPPCDNPELCPPQYWAQSQAWQEHQEAVEIGLDDFLFSQFINTLPQEQLDFLNDFDNWEIRESFKNFLSENGYNDVNEDFIADALEVFTYADNFTSDNQLDYAQAILRLTTHMKSFGNIEDEIYADYIESLIPDLGSMTIGEVDDLYEEVYRTDRNITLKYAVGIFTVIATDLVIPVVEYALFQATVGLAVKLLQKIPLPMLLRGARLTKLLQKVARMGVQGEQIHVRIITTSSPVTRAEKLFATLTKNAVSVAPPNAQGTIVANMGNGNYITFRTVSSTNFPATINLNFPSIFGQTPKAIKFQAP